MYVPDGGFTRKNHQRSVVHICPVWGTETFASQLPPRKDIASLHTWEQVDQKVLTDVLSRSTPTTRCCVRSRDKTPAHLPPRTPAWRPAFLPFSFEENVYMETPTLFV